jgi:hypothetical protein
MGCFLDAHDTINVRKLNVYREVLFLTSMLAPKSLRVYLMSLKSYEVEYYMPKYFVPFTYLNILFPSFQCDSFGVSMNLDIRLTPYIISDVVAMRYIRLPTSLLNIVGSTLDLTFLA